MLIDLLDSANYIMVNRNAIKVFGLVTALYCAELLNVYKKVIKKKTFVNNDLYFRIDREYITKQTSLLPEEQLKCDLNLVKVNVIKVDKENPDIIYFDVELFASLLASENIKLLDGVSKKVKVDNPKGTKEAAKERMIIALKESIECKNFDVLNALRNWIDAVYASGKGLSKQAVKLFKDKIDDYCNGDVKLALDVINVAIIHSYVDCQWAINLYEKEKKGFVSSSNNTVPRNTIRVTQQRVTTKDQLGERSF